MKEVLIVGLGGFAGSISRYMIQLALLSRFTLTFPLGTFVINLAGSFIVGLIFGLADRYQWMNADMRLLLAVGFCGSFTTFSAFAFDNMRMLEDGNYLNSLSYIAFSIILGIALAWLGFIIMKG